MVVGDVSSSVEEADAAEVDAASAVDRITDVVDNVARRVVIITCRTDEKPRTPPKAVRDTIIANKNNDTLRWLDEAGIVVPNR